MTKITHVTNPRAKAFYISKKQLMWPLQNPQMSNVKMWSWDVTNVKCQILRCYTSHHRASHVTTRLNRSNSTCDSNKTRRQWSKSSFLLHCFCICICILQSCVPQNAFAFAFCKVVFHKMHLHLHFAKLCPQNAFAFAFCKAVFHKMHLFCKRLKCNALQCAISNPMSNPC